MHGGSLAEDRTQESTTRTPSRWASTGFEVEAFAFRSTAAERPRVPRACASPRAEPAHQAPPTGRRGARRASRPARAQGRAGRSCSRHLARKRARDLRDPTTGKHRSDRRQNNPRPNDAQRPGVARHRSHPMGALPPTLEPACNTKTLGGGSSRLPPPRSALELRRAKYTNTPTTRSLGESRALAGPGLEASGVVRGQSSAGRKHRLPRHHRRGTCPCPTRTGENVPRGSLGPLVGFAAAGSAVTSRPGSNSCRPADRPARRAGSFPRPAPRCTDLGSTRRPGRPPPS